MSVPDTVLGDQEEAVANAVDQFVDEMISHAEAPQIDAFVKRFPSIQHVLRNVLPAIQLMHCPDSPGAAAVTADTLGVSGTLGDFRILKELGRGGMGVVYEAEQISLGRRVALKTLPMASAINPVRLNRFRNEAQAAAQLHHPNIVPVYAVGTERGVWYYAMQIIDGPSLAEVIEAIRTGASPPELERDPASTDNAFQSVTGIETPGHIRGAALLCQQAARALEHAHDMDIVHRDIKPGNLMIDGHGKLFVTDFGLARFRNENGLTLSGDVVGTLAYMSPEQARGENAVVDHRSDVYSLGATLYELATLSRPFEEENRAAMLSRIIEGNLTRPRQINPALPIDVETIILKSMSLEPGHRYPTVAQLADDLTRFLEDQPILARRPTVMDRCQRWCRRHRSIVALGLITGLMMCVGLLVSTVAIATEQARTESALKQISKRETSLRFALARQDQLRAEAQANLRQAEENFLKARDVLDFFVASVDEDLGGHDSLRMVRTRLLQTSLDYYRDFSEQAQDKPRLQSQLVKSRYHVARILSEIGTSPETEEAIERALRAQEELALANPHDWQMSRDLWSMYLQLGSFSGTESMRLILEPEVQDELSLSQEQVCTCYEIADDFLGHDTMALSEDITKTRHQFRERTDHALSAIARMLTVQQNQRLAQVELQVQGSRAWKLARVTRELALTTEQRRAIDQVDGETRRAVWGAYAKGRFRQVRQQYTRANEQVLALLTDEQTKKWATMIGEDFPMARRLRMRPDPFRFSYSPRAPRPRPRRGSGSNWPNKQRPPDENEVQSQPLRIKR